MGEADLGWAGWEWVGRGGSGLGGADLGWASVNLPGAVGGSAGTAEPQGTTSHLGQRSGAVPT